MTTFDGWDPEQYNRFAGEREQPFWDLVGLLAPTEAPDVVDLGCGDGRLTAALADRLTAGSMLGIDSSPSMIGGSSSLAGERLRFEIADIGDWAAPGSFDIVFANASMQWVPDHPSVLARWAGSLKPGGQLAVQVPSNADHPAHTVATEVGREFLAEPPPDPVAENVLEPERYAEILDSLGFGDQQVRLQVYAHHLGSTAAVVEWVKGTTLTRFKEPLGPDRWPQFVDAYRERLLSVLGDHSPFFYPFKRLLLWGKTDGAALTDNMT